MSFYFCLTVLLVTASFRTSAENNGYMISGYSRAAAFRNFFSNFYVGRPDIPNAQYGYGQNGYDYDAGRPVIPIGQYIYGYGQKGFGYGKDTLYGFRYAQDGYSQADYGNGLDGTTVDDYDYDQDDYSTEDSQDSYDNGEVGDNEIKNIRRRALAKDIACQIPNDLKDSEVNCKIYSAKIVCNHTCMFGYTFSEGIQRQMECIYSKDKWTPVPEFESCKPFVDCGLTMNPGGGYICQKDFMDKGPICEVYCEPYEDKDAVKAQTYSCDIEGKWTPELPFCAKPGSGMNLVPVPSGPLTKHN